MITESDRTISTKIAMGLTLRLVLVSLMCLQTNLAIGAVIKRTGTQFFESDGDIGLDRRVFGPEKCQLIPETILSAVLGPAFNARYMSIDNPRDNVFETESQVHSGVAKRKTNNVPSFFVDEEFNAASGNDPAWDFEFANTKYDTAEEKRDIRHVKRTPWQCNEKVEWIDLGRNYFPRFLRSVQCEKTDCWHGLYTCKPKSFAVKLLRRRSEICIRSKTMDRIVTTLNTGVTGLPEELTELWVWEERAVTFCCECAAGTRQ